MFHIFSHFFTLFTFVHIFEMRFFHIFLNCIFETHFFQIFNSNYYNPSVAQLALINVKWSTMISGNAFVPKWVAYPKLWPFWCRNNSQPSILRLYWFNTRNQGFTYENWDDLQRLDSTTDFQIWDVLPPPNIKYPLVNQHNHGKSPFLMGRSTISMAIFNS